jgi:hypothetical protein
MMSRAGPAEFIELTPLDAVLIPVFLKENLKRFLEAERWAG